MRTILWLASGIAALLLVIAAVLGLSGTAPDRAAQHADLPRQPPAAAPAAPLPKPPSEAARQPPSFDIVTIGRDGQAVIAGRAMPGDRVRVIDGGKPLGEVTADARGEWVLVPDSPVPPGDRELSLEATGRDGTVRRSEQVVALSVKPSEAGHGTTALAVLLPGDASRPARVLQRPEAGSEPALSLDAAQYGEPDRLVLSGRAAPGARLSIRLGERLLGAATADAAGKWALTAVRQPPEGGELRVEQLAADGTVAARIAVALNPRDAAAVAGSYIVRRGNSLWRIAQQTYGAGNRYAEIYAANRDRIQDPDLIYPGQQFALPKP